MKIRIIVEEEDIDITIEDAALSTYRRVGRRPASDGGCYMESYPQGKPIMIITSNMPESLKDEIDLAISTFCDH